MRCRSSALVRRMLCVFGASTALWGEIKYIKGEPTDAISFDSPALLAIIARLWWRYGSLRQEAHDSWVCCRLIAFASTALFGGQLEAISVGDPVAGFIEATSDENNTAQLTGWPPISAAEWKLRQTRSFPGDGFEVNGDALAVLPAVASGRFGHTPPPNVSYARLHGHKVPKYFDMPIGPDPDAQGRQREPRNSPERRMRDRFHRKQAERRAASLSASAPASRQPRWGAPPA